MTIGTVYEYKGNQLKEDLNPLLDQFGYEGRAATRIINDGKMAESDVPEWISRDLANPTINAQAEAFSYSTVASNVAVGTRYRNFTQILAWVIQVSETSEAVNLVGGPGVLDQTKLRMMNYLNDLEYSTLNATGQSGTSGTTVRQMFGIFSWALNFGDTGTETRSWNTTSSGVSADTSFLTTLQIHGAKKNIPITDFIVDDTIKRRVSLSSSTAAPVYRVQSDADIISAIDMFKTDFGGSRLHWSNFVEHQAGTSTGLFSMGANGHFILGVDASCIDRAWLRKTRIMDVPPTSDAITKCIKGEVTNRYWVPTGIQVFWNVF